MAARWLIAEWPIGAAAPAKCCFANLPETTSKKDLVWMVKTRWWVEHSYEELKDKSFSTTSKDAPDGDGMITSLAPCWLTRLSSKSIEKGDSGLTFPRLCRLPLSCL